MQKILLLPLGLQLQPLHLAAQHLPIHCLRLRLERRRLLQPAPDSAQRLHNRSVPAGGRGAQRRQLGDGKAMAAAAGPEAEQQQVDVESQALLQGQACLGDAWPRVGAQRVGPEGIVGGGRFAQAASSPT